MPKVTAPPTVASLSASPSDAELTRTRIFPEPLMPMPRATTAAENAALARAIREYARTADSEQVAPLLAFLAAHPQSAWKASLLANLGTVYRSTGQLSRALNAWDLAWTEAKDETDPRARAVADFAIGEWFELSHKIGRPTKVVERLKEVEGRHLAGRAGQKMALAREGVWVTRVHHDVLASGAAAIESILAFDAYDKQQRHAPNPAVQAYHSTAAGMSLAEVKTLALQAGLRWQMVFRPADAPYPAPVIVHFRADHYVAVVKAERGGYLVIDPAVGGQIWMSRAALEDEGSGYLLAPVSPAIAGWRVVANTEARTVIGHCLPGAPDDDDPCPCGGGGGGAPGGGGPGGGPGMATYSLQLMPASLRLTDQPLTYAAPVGPQAPFRVTYNQREAGQPQVFTFGNLGPKWTFDWLSWVTDNPNAADVQADVALRGGGAEHYLGGAGSGVYAAHWRSRAVLAKVSTTPIRYERRLPDGGVEVFAQSDGVITAGRHVYLTDVIDPQGLTLHFTYDANLRLVALTDAIGQVTTVSYDLASDATKITKVTDPYGRFATLTYNAVGELATITDVIGLTSSFAYGPGDFVTSLTTPYGTTLFTHETDASGTNSFRFVQATDPLGGTERVEFRWTTTDVAATAPSAQVPTGFSAYNNNLDHYNSFYWDRRAMALYPGDVSKATITHWLLYTYVSYTPIFYSHAFSTSVPHSVKRPLESRIWYAYPDQDINGNAVGSWNQPTKVARVLDDGASQISQATYNVQGQATTRTDPVGRQTTYVYAVNGIDLLEMRQTTTASNDLLLTLSNYTSNHRAQTSTDAAGQTTTYTFNPNGQILTSTNAKNETTAYTYDLDGRIQTVTAPIPGARTSYTYDTYGRIRTVTDPDGYAVTTDFDALDRPVLVTYPDATTESRTYNRLDPSSKADRLGHLTRYFYDPLRRLIATRDPQGNTVTQQWCACGSLDATIDANGQATQWERDIEGRATREIRADGTTSTLSIYETTTSRLKTVTDAKGQTATYAYNVDDTLQSVAYTNAVIATPSVSYTYDTTYGRPSAMTDGTGTTNYTYGTVGAPGAGRVIDVDGPMTNDTIAYGYDALGRIVGQTINSVSLTQSYDALGRVDTEINVLGTFAYAYEGVTKRLASVSYPNGQTSTYTYLGHTGDHRLQTIHHRKADGTTLSKFDYTHDPVGNVTTWRQQADTTSVLWRYRFDATNRLASAVAQTVNPPSSVLQRFAYRYDPAGNRTVEQIDDAATTSDYSSLNRLLSQHGGGAIAFKGVVNEPATVLIQGKPAAVSAGNEFSGVATVSTGTTAVTVTATDASGNVTTEVYQVDQAVASRTFVYDANGNLTTDGARSFEWDARNRMVAVTVGTRRSEFVYDGSNRRTRIIEKDGTTVVKDQQFVVTPDGVAERREVGGAVVRLFWGGMDDGGTPTFFTRDHLDSVREITDARGSVQSRMQYDPFGRTTRTVNTSDVLEFTGVLTHQPSGLSLMKHREYDPNLARWLSEDPLGLKAGPNLYAYVLNEPLRWIDPDGTFIFKPFLPNGNISSSFDRQNGLCDVPGFMGWDGKSCVTKCCADHDVCYSESRCNWTSWLTVAYDSSCSSCNRTGASCIIKALPLPPSACTSCQAK